MEYQLIEADTDKELVTLVNHAIIQGWLPHGGVSVSIAVSAEDGWNYHYAQAMTREEI